MKNAEEMRTNLVEVLSKEGIADAMKAADSPEALRDVFKNSGLDATDEEIEGLIEVMAEAGQTNQDGEISEDVLEDVAGGLGWFDLPNIAKKTWDIGTWVAGKLVYGDQKTAQKEIIKFWKGVLHL